MPQTLVVGCADAPSRRVVAALREAVVACGGAFDEARGRRAYVHVRDAHGTWLELHDPDRVWVDALGVHLARRLSRPCRVVLSTTRRDGSVEVREQVVQATGAFGPPEVEELDDESVSGDLHERADQGAQGFLDGVAGEDVEVLTWGLRAPASTGVPKLDGLLSQMRVAAAISVLPADGDRVAVRVSTVDGASVTVFLRPDEVEALKPAAGPLWPGQAT